MTNRLLLGFSLCALLSTSAWGQTYTISTYAGNGTAGFAGDGGALAGSQLSSPGGVAIDSSGNVYIADSGNNRVRKISNGTISTLAGNGTAGYSGDNAAATAAMLSSPSAVAVDSSGNVYIADSGNFCVRKVATSGTITTFAGQCTFIGYSGDGAPANQANLSFPNGLAFDPAGNLYITDSVLSLIRKVASNGIITTVVGSGATSGRLNNPTGIAFDSASAMYIADTNNRRIAKFVPGTLSNFAGNGGPGFSGDGGLAVLASLYNPSAVTVDAAGNLFIADTTNSRIRKVAGGIITTIAGSSIAGYAGDGGPATSASLRFPHGVTVDSKGNIYVSDSANNVIRLLQPVAVAPPVISDGGVVNPASYLAKLSPGALASIYGSNFGTQTIGPSTPPFPTVAGGVSVTVNGKLAPLQYVSPNQVNFQVPWDAAVGTGTVSVSVNSTASPNATVPIMTAAPGLFVQPNGSAVVQNADYSLNTPSNPAAGGSAVVAYLTGSGPVDQTIASGAATPLSPITYAKSSSSATIGSTPAQLVFTGLTPSFVGLTQVNIVIPTTLASGDYPLTITIAGEASNTATISVKQ